MIIIELKLQTLLIILLLIVVKANSQDKIHLSGKIVDIQSDKSIGFANIGIVGKSIGTISNKDGDFELFIPKIFSNDYLVVSYIGYKSYKGKISEISNKFINIKLEEENIEIEEVVVSSLTPEALLIQVLEKIPENYSSVPYMCNAFYREIAKENKRTVAINEALMEVYKTSYQPDKEVDQARVIKGRNVESKDFEVFKNMRVSGAAMGGIGYDIAKYKAGFINPTNFKYYEYKYDNSTKYNGKTVYVIAFDQKEGLKKPFSKGKIYIDIHSLGIVSVNFQYSPKGIKYIRAGRLQRLKMKFYGIEVEYEKIKFSVNYEEQENRWYLKSTSYELEAVLKNKKTNDIALIDLSQSLLITERNLLKVSRIPKGQQINKNSFMADEMGEYDEEFWENYNIIKAGSDVKKAAEEIEKANEK